MWPNQQLKQGGLYQGGKRSAPRSLGLVGQNEFTLASQLTTYEPTTISDAVYAISLEPTGGSPTGQPTGPVLWTSKLIEAVPSK